MITVEVEINAPISKVWEYFTQPEYITQWNFASPEWCCPTATNDLEPGRGFSWRMESKDGTMGFDFNGTYSKVEKESQISYTMEDGRKVDIHFQSIGSKIKLTEAFEPEGTNTDEMQRAGWQAILNNFKHLVESDT